MNLKEESYEWALLHLNRFYDSDFFPKSFEFSAIRHNWEEVKNQLIEIDLTKYIPRNPYISLALKPNRNYRVVHQLDPLDSLVYTALLYDVCIQINAK